MRKFIVIVACCVVAGGAMAKSAGFQLSLTPGIAIQDRETEITGVSIGVWNENPSPKFQWQFGFVNGATGDSVGIQWFVFLPTIYNYAENYSGGQLALVNYTSGDFLGAQLGVVNITTGSLTGLQWGTVNYAKTSASGVQLGLVNYAGTVSDWCFQLGLVNIIADNAWFNELPSEFAKGFVIANWSFGNK